MSIGQIYLLSKKAPYMYKVYEIPKATNRGFRTIAQPSRRIKDIQRIISRIFLSLFPVSDAATAYVNKKNILDNATPHKDSAYLLKLDFSDFFPSIKPADLLRAIDTYAHAYQGVFSHISDIEMEVMVHFLFWHNRRAGEKTLSIGAPSSPIVSNIVMYDFDRHIEGLCASRGVNYSRYADDLTFSSNSSTDLVEILNAVGNYINSTNSPKLKINNNKTVFIFPRQTKRVTGLIINEDGRITIGKWRKKIIKSALDKITKGTFMAVPEERRVHAKGLLSYAKSVEPIFYNGLLEKYGISAVKTLLQQEQRRAP